MNVCTMHGRIANELELRQVNDKCLTNFTLAVDREKKGSGCDWIPCVAWGKTAEVICKYMHKGSEIAVTGRWHSDSYKDKNGNKQYTHKLSISSMDFCGSRADNQEQVETMPNLDDMMANDVDDAIPFN